MKIWEPMNSNIDWPLELVNCVLISCTIDMYWGDFVTTAFRPTLVADNLVQEITCH